MSLDGRCTICEGDGAVVIYEGPVRAGMAGKQCDGLRVLECRNCGTQRLDPFPADPLRAYLDGSYRAAYDGSAEVAAYHKAHDGEQAAKLSAVGVQTIRNKVVADIGCGAGAFLDTVRGAAKRCIGVEPMQAFRAHLEKKLSVVYTTTAEMAASERGQVDVAVAFAVIEHVADPKQFLREIKQSLTPSGEVHVTTPNRNEILMRLCSQSFMPFFYRTAHLWYFDIHSLTRLAQQAGFRVRTIATPHSYDLSNFALWLRDNQPTGTGRVSDFGPVLDSTWRAHLIQNGWGDQLYAVLEPDWASGSRF